MRMPRGYIVIETIVAMILLTILAGVLATAIYHHEFGLRHLADIRAASRLAESELIAMQSGNPSTQPSSIQRLNFDAPAGFNWVSIQTTVNGRKSSLVGLVPRGTP